MSRSGKLQRTLLVALGLALALGVVEAALRLAGSMSFRSAARHSTADAITVLCIGDSHTWGDGEGVPARLAERLAERSSRYRVVNLGVPGTNTAQHRERLDSYLDSFTPSLIVFWGGLNNVWNRTGTEAWTEAGIEKASRWRSLLDEIRILRFVRVWRHQAALREILAQDHSYVAPEIDRGGTWHRKLREQRLGDSTDTFVNVREEFGHDLEPDLLVRATAGDIAWMIERARARGVPVLAITYPHETSHFKNVNTGIRWAARNTGARVVDAMEAKRRLVGRMTSVGGEVPRFFDRTAHPTQELYAEIADLTLETIDEEELLERAR